jgi:hypothetical protein
MILTIILSGNLLTNVLLTKKTTPRPSSRRNPPSPKASSRSSIHTKIKRLCHAAPRLNPKVLQLALTAYNNANKRGNVKKPVLTVIDYSMPSNKQRMWVFDVRKERLLYNTYVAHGRNSGPNIPKHFSNKGSSKQSSLGTYITTNTYIGHKGYSLNLKGLDKGFNDNAYNRRVVMHGAWYMEPSFIRRAGRAGLSWGCPAISQTMAKPVINAIKNGSVIFAYFPDKYFLSHSGYLIA